MVFNGYSKIGSVQKHILSILEKRPVHVSLIDPDPSKVTLKQIDRISKLLNKFGTDAILVGGSDNIENNFVNKFILTIRKNYKSHIILYPGNLEGISKYADAILFMTLMNSRNPERIIGMQARGSLIIRKFKLEPIPMAYLIVEPGQKVGIIGEADLIKRNEYERAAQYALAAQYFGMSMVYLEAGSGADKPVPIKMIKEVSKNIEIPLIVGGGLRTENDVKERLRAGANIIVTGTILENEDSIKNIEGIINTIRNY